MAKRLQYHPGQIHLTSYRRRPPTSDSSTEFCVRASKLTFGTKTKVDENHGTPAGRYSDCLSVVDMAGIHSQGRRSAMTRGSTSSVPDTVNRTDACRSLGIMGRKYFKKPNGAAHDKVAKTNVQDDISDCEAQLSPRIPILPSNDQTCKLGKDMKQKSSFVSTEFGFKSRRTDAFSGKARKRVPRGSKLEKDIAEGARKHIIACHIASTARRGCPAIQKYHALRDCVSPANKSLKHQQSEIVAGSYTENRSKPYIAKLKMTRSTVSLSTTSIDNSNMLKLPEVVGTVVHKAAKPSHPVA